MDPTEGLKSSSAFGPNVPAGIEVLMGGHAAQGKLPVDLYDVAVDEDGASFNLDSIAYPFGFGLKYRARGNEGPEVDKSALQTAVDDIEANVVPHKDTYTEATYAMLQSALDAAHAVLDDGAATQEQVDTALAALSSAREGLALVSIAPDPTPDPNKNKGGQSKVPNTGDPSSLAAVAAAAAVGAAALGTSSMLRSNDNEPDE
jgi:beta-N-acetylhexosaminidase